MGRSIFRQETQIRNSDLYDDTLALSIANFETNPVDIEADLNSLRSHAKRVMVGTAAGDWYTDLVAPSTLEAGVQRGVNQINDSLHAVEKKRVLKCVWGLKSISIAAAGNVFDILGTGELPGNTTAAVGAVTTLGTVVASIAGSFGAASLVEVAGSTAISPKNLVQIVDAATRDPILDGDDKIYGLLQSETAADGHTITDATTTRVQLSFVKLNGAGNDLIAISSGAMDGVSYDYCYVERVRLEDLNEADFLGGANIDVPSGTTVTRQVAYDNQGASLVTTTTNADLRLGVGLRWLIEDQGGNDMLRLVEGDAGGTGVLEVGVGVDTFDVNAAVVDFSAGVTIRSGGTRPIVVGVTDGLIATTAGDLEVQAAAELLFDDGNRGASTFSVPLKLTETSAEWTALEDAFGEVSLAQMLLKGGTRRRVYSVVTVDAAKDADVSGPSNDNNLDADLGDLSGGSFVDDYDFYVNGGYQRPGANAAANHDVYPGTSLANGQLKFELKLKVGDQLCVVDKAP